MEIANVKSSAVKAIDSATSEQTSDALPRPASPRAAEAPLDPERVTISKLHEFYEANYEPSEVPLSIEKTLTFLYSQPNMLVNAARENDLELLNILLDISIKTESEDDILHRMAELKQHIASYADLLGNNVFLALAKNRWPEAHLATAHQKKTWTADQWLTFLEDIKDTLAFDYISFNVHDISSDDWEQITQDWDLEKKLQVFNQLIHLSSVQPSDPISREYDAQELFAQMEINAKTRKEIVTGFFNEDVDYFCNFLSALERLHNRENYRTKQDYDIEKDQRIIRNPSSLLNSIFLATHPLASEFKTHFDEPFMEQERLSPIWLSTLITLAEHNHGKLVLDIVKSVEIKDVAFWTSLLKAASNSVEGGELADLAKEAVPGKIDLKLIQSCKASTEELKKLNVHEWECCAKTKTGHIFRPNYNELTEDYNPNTSTDEAFPAIIPTLLEEKKTKPFKLNNRKIAKPHPLTGIIILAKGTSIDNPVQFFLPDPFTLEAALRAKCRHLRIHHYPENYTSKEAKRSFPLLSIKLSNGIADDRDFILWLIENDVVLSINAERVHDSFAHLAAIFKELRPGNTYIGIRDARRKVFREALTLIDEDTTLNDEGREQLYVVLGAIVDAASTDPYYNLSFSAILRNVFQTPQWVQHFKTRFPDISTEDLYEKAQNIFVRFL